jgi:lysophospholipase L1-like esterase
MPRHPITASLGVMDRTVLAPPLLALVAAVAGCGSPADAQPQAPLQVVALGDSISTSNACPGCTAFPERYGDHLSEELGREVRVDNRSIPGAMVADLVQQVATDEETRKSLRGADVVLVTVGINDSAWGRGDDPCGVAPDFPVVDWDGITQKCADKVSREYARELDLLLDKVGRLHRGSPYALRLPTVYNAVIGDHVDPTWDSPEAVGPSVRGNAAFAQVQCRLAADHGGRCAQMLPLMNGPDGLADAAPFLADDHTHLNQAGHDLTAGALVELGLD